MPIVAFLHLAVAAFFAVHAVRTGRERYWLMVLFAFPLMGSIVYFFAEYAGDLSNTRGGQRALRLMQGVIDPDRELRLATAAFDRTPTAFNEAQLARALLAKGEVDQAIVHYQQCIAGPYAKDASFLKGLAIAQIEGNHHANAITTLEALFAAHPDQRSGDIALMYAEALAGAQRPEADAAFESVIEAGGSIEARCKYGQFLLGRSRAETARHVFEEILADAQRIQKHSRELNREWISAAQQALKQLSQT